MIAADVNFKTHTGMIIAVSVLNANGDVRRSCVNASTSSQDSSRRQLFEVMDHIVEQNSASGARAFVYPSNIVQGSSPTWPASLLSPASEGHRLLKGRRSRGSKGSVPDASKDGAGIGVFNLWLITPAITSSLFLLCASMMTLKNPNRRAMKVFIKGTFLVFAGLVIYAFYTIIFLVFARSMSVMKSTSATGEGKCHAMFSAAGIGCLIGTIGALGSFIASICATCGIRKATEHVAQVEEVMRSRAAAQLHHYGQDNEATVNNTGYPSLSDYLPDAGWLKHAGEKKEVVGPHKVVVVTDVADGCAASLLVVKGDTILAINGIPLTDERQGRSLARAAVGKVAFSILREGARVTITADKPDATTRLGVTMKNLPLASIPVVVTDVAAGCAASNQVIKGDTIVAINGVQLTDEVHGRALARAAVGEVVLSILREGANVTITVDKPEAATRLGVTMKNLVPLAWKAQPIVPMVYAQPTATPAEGNPSNDKCVTSF